LWWGSGQWLDGLRVPDRVGDRRRKGHRARLARSETATAFAAHPTPLSWRIAMRMVLNGAGARRGLLIGLQSNSAGDGAQAAGGHGDTYYCRVERLREAGCRRGEVRVALAARSEVGRGPRSFRVGRSPPPRCVQVVAEVVAMRCRGHPDVALTPGWELRPCTDPE
jgi:hypothetical protein